MNAASDLSVSQTRPSSDWSVDLLGRFRSVIGLAVLCIVFALLEPVFLDPQNLFNVLRQISITGIVAVGMTFVILTAGIDLSVGSVLALGGLVSVLAAKGTFTASAAGSVDPGGLAVLWAVLAALAVGLVAGALQGVAIAKMRVPAFVVTLGGLSIYRGVSLLISDGRPITGLSEDFRFWGIGMIGPVPVLVIIFLVVAVTAHVVLRYTRFGRWIYAVGGNAEAARISGLDTTKVVIGAYVISAVCASLAGFLLAGRLSSAETVAGVGLELSVIAAVVIGGTSLFGGQGTVFGTVVGALLIGVLSNGLTLMNVSSYYQQIVVGLVIVLAVFLDQVAKSRAR